MKLVIFFSIALALLTGSCSSSQSESSEPKKCFWRFSHVFETCSRDRSRFSHARTDEPVTTAQADTLKRQFEEDGWDYFQAKDGEIWISDLFVPDLAAMYNLDSRLFERLKIERKSWKYDDE